MNNIILINKNEIGEIKVAFIENGILTNFEIENKNSKYQKGNIFKGYVTKIEISLDVLFIDYGANKNGFLPFKEISKDYLSKFNIFDDTEETKKSKKMLGQSFIVQIEKREDTNKGASLTTYINLAGCYLVLMPNSIDLKGISKKINKNKRFQLKKTLTDINISNNTGMIIRTFGHGKKTIEFKMELLMLLSQLKLTKISHANIFSSYFIYEHNNLIIKTVRDHLKSKISKIVIDDIYLFNLIYKYFSIMKSKLLNKIHLHINNLSLFNKYNINQQIEILFKREIFLPSGGSITIDIEEALIFIDINSSKSNKCDDIEETSLQINLEALTEITRQLRLRDLGGLIIIDFIDINLDNFTLIEEKLKELLLNDKANIKIEKISKFGLLEMSREKIKTIFSDSNSFLCKKCQGTGKTSNIIEICLNIIESIEAELIKKKITQINLELPVKTSNYIINSKKDNIKNIEKNNNIKINLITNEFLIYPDYKIFSFKRKNKKIKNKKIKSKIISYLKYFSHN